MNKLKPVAWMWEYRGFSFVTGSEAKAIELQEDPEIEVTPLYAIPDKLNAQWLPPSCPVYQHHVSIERRDDVESGGRAQEPSNANTNNPPA